MLLIFGVFGGVVWGFIGFILQRLRESRLRLDTLNRELLKQTRHLNTYLTISSMVAQCLDLPELLEAILPSVMETVSAEEASCKGCQRPLKSWTPCVKYLEKSI